MLTPELMAWLGAAIRWALILLAGLVLSWICTLLVEPLRLVTDDVTAALARFRERLASGPLLRLRQGLTARWEAYRSEYEPTALSPVASFARSGLRWLRKTLDRFGQPQLEALNRFQDTAQVQLSTIGELPHLPPPPIDPQALQAAAGQSAERTLDLARALVATLFTLVVVFFNTYMLNLFFAELLEERNPIWLEWPIEVSLSLVLGLVFAGVEVALGFLAYRPPDEAPEDRQLPSPAQLIPMLGVLAAALAELYAYATLSVALDLPRRLRIAETSQWYPLAQYFLAFFGFSITLVLAHLGHTIWKYFERYLRRRQHLNLHRALRRYARLFDQRELARRVTENVDGLHAVLRDVPERLLRDFGRAIGTPNERDSALAQVERHLQTLGSKSARPARSYPPAAEILVSLFLLALSMGLASFAYQTFRQALGNSGGGPLSIAALGALLLAAAIIASGWLLKVIAVGSDLSPRFASHVADPVMRCVLAALLIFVLFAPGVYFTVRSFMQTGAFGPSMGLNVVAGLIVATALLVCSAFLDLYFRAAYLVFVLVVYGLAIVGVSLLSAGAAVLAALLVTVLAIMRLLAVPGSLLRPRPATVASS